MDSGSKTDQKKEKSGCGKALAIFLAIAIILAIIALEKIKNSI